MRPQLVAMTIQNTSFSSFHLAQPQTKACEHNRKGDASVKFNWPLLAADVAQMKTCDIDVLTVLLLR